MYSDLIIGFDGSAAAHDALAFARRLALATGGRPRVVCVRTRGAVEPTLDEARELIGDVPGATFEAVSGASPARGLCAAAASTEAALLVLGSTHRSGLGRVVAGSTAEAVVHGAPCAVAIVPAGYAETAARRPFGLVAAAVDGGGETDRVARIAARIADGAGADLRLVCVVERPYADGPLYTAGISYVTVENARRSAAITALEQAAAAAGGAGVDVERRLCEGLLAAEVATESEAADLLVIGSRGLGPLGRVVLGAATGRILHAAVCPVLVVPRRAAEWLDDALVPLAEAGVR
jgi:nucleotide-binding universal stress UspA family protein